MKKFRMLAALTTAAALMLSFTTVAFAAEPSGETSDTTSSTTSGVSTSSGTSDVSTPAGTGTVIADTTNGSGKEFLTITTPDKHIFYMVIDRDQKSNNVYFLDTVTEKDLMSLAEQSGNSQSNTSGSAVSGSTSTPAQTSGSGDTTQKNTDKSSKPANTTQHGNGVGMLVVVAMVVLIGGGAGYYFKIYRPKHQRAGTEEEDYTPEDEAEPRDEEETEPDGDLPPWDEDDGGDAGESGDETK